MIVTLNEIEQWCLRVMTSMGTPQGVAEDAAGAASWLAARGFDAFESLIAAHDRWAGDTSAMAATALSEERGLRRLQADGRSAIFLAGPLVDMAVADAKIHGRSVVEVSSLRDPLFLLPAADRYRRRGWNFAIEWAAQGECSGAVHVGADGVSLMGDTSTRGPFRVTTVCARDTNAPPYSDAASRLPVTLSAGDLAARAQATLETGVEVADSTWTRLKELGMGALVPASDVSRQRGAGSQASDNE